MSTSSAHFLANITTDFYTGLVSTTPPPDKTPPYVGYVCALVAVIFYGSNFVPVKQFETGDGKLVSFEFFIIIPLPEK